MPYAGMVLHRQNKYIGLFEKAGAVDTDHAVTLDRIGIKKDSVFEKMTALKVFEQCENGSFFMNSEIAEKLKENRSGFNLWRLDKK